MKRVWVSFDGLSGCRGGDIGMRVTDRGDADAAAEVDQLVAVDIHQNRAGTVIHVDVGERAGTAADRRDPALLQGDRLRPGQFGDEPALLRHAEFHTGSLRPRA